MAAAQIVVDFVSRKSGKQKADILFYGHSMGGAITTLTVSKVAPKKVILYNPLDALSNVMVDGCVMTGFLAGSLTHTKKLY